MHHDMLLNEISYTHFTDEVDSKFTNIIKHSVGLDQNLTGSQESLQGDGTVAPTSLHHANNDRSEAQFV